ncbi:phage antirepressor [Gordonia rubripertincta]|uniref:Phage antirepressor n=1 Tax=Gordonia rubripertincta TaxID=36822 RepID=A0AAW4GAU7_GORRU|nr:phage antirepressor N-terminal domain-containing protein [Gordonia rubripertincta]MBM7280318.1 phage antirepressor [Gordonia rubripertincta]QMU19308.1 phage antirepressor [Gordonia rubripertincta]
MATDLVHIPVPGTDRQIVATQMDGLPMVSLRHACDAIGLDFANQHRKLKSRSWARVALIATPSAGGAQMTAMIDRRTFTMWLATIDTNRVSDEARPIIEAFQAEAADALDAYFATGVAVATESNLSQFDILRAAIDRLEESERVAAEAKQIAERSEARLDGIEGKHDWFSALGYAKLHGLPTYTRFLQKLGKCASMIARTHDIQPEKAQHAHYGTVNSYPEWIWKLAADGLGTES